MLPALVLFDLDGTLVDSLHDLTDAVNHMLVAFERPKLTSVEVRQLVGKGARNLVQRALTTDSEPDIHRGLTLFTEFNTAHIADKSTLYPDVVPMLQQLQKAGIRLALISNKPEALSLLIMKTLGVQRYFELIAGGDTFPEMKPSPLPLLRAVDQLGGTRSNTVMVGDSINDIQAGVDAGITTIGCSWGYGKPGELDRADRRVDTCANLTTMLLSGEI